MSCYSIRLLLLFLNYFFFSFLDWLPIEETIMTTYLIFAFYMCCVHRFTSEICVDNNWMLGNVIFTLNNCLYFIHIHCESLVNVFWLWSNHHPCFMFHIVIQYVELFLSQCFSFVFRFNFWADFVSHFQSWLSLMFFFPSSLSKIEFHLCCELEGTSCRILVLIN